MLVVDKQNLMINWNPSLSSEIKEVWLYYYMEQSDYDSTKIDEDLKSNPLPNLVSSRFAYFSLWIYPNREFELRTSEFWSYVIKEPDFVYDHKMNVECLSKVCPDFICYSLTNHTFWSDFR